MKIAKAFFPLLLLVTILGGCASTAKAVSSVVVSMTSASPTQAKTLADAILMTTTMEQGITAYADSGKASKPVINELLILMPAIHNTLKAGEQANAAGNNAALAAALAAFNEAVSAYNSYKALKGIQ